MKPNILTLRNFPKLNCSYGCGRMVEFFLNIIWFWLVQLQEPTSLVLRFFKPSYSEEFCLGLSCQGMMRQKTYIVGILNWNPRTRLAKLHA